LTKCSAGHDPGPAMQIKKRLPDRCVFMQGPEAFCMPMFLQGKHTCPTTACGRAFCSPAVDRAAAAGRVSAGDVRRCLGCRIHPRSVGSRHIRPDRQGFPAARSGCIHADTTVRSQNCSRQTGASAGRARMGRPADTGACDRTSWFKLLSAETGSGQFFLCKPAAKGARMLKKSAGLW